ncbi:hypothetical protein Mapa_017479 [Marchantia paleacea]|nr:hypothetical protein Mapa_017479 [Marchantia paleacea]
MKTPISHVQNKGEEQVSVPPHRPRDHKTLIGCGSHSCNPANHFDQRPWEQKRNNTSRLRRVPSIVIAMVASQSVQLFSLHPLYTILPPALAM